MPGRKEHGNHTYDIVEFRDEMNGSKSLPDDKASFQNDLSCDDLWDMEHGHDDVEVSEITILVKGPNIQSGPEARAMPFYFGMW
jgi:hypothetical protein